MESCDSSSVSVEVVKPLKCYTRVSAAKGGATAETQSPEDPGTPVVDIVGGEENTDKTASMIGITSANTSKSSISCPLKTVSGPPPAPPTKVGGLKHVLLKTDPITGRKYIIKDGKRIDVISDGNKTKIGTNLNLARLLLPTKQKLLKVQPITRLEPPPLISRTNPPALTAIRKQHTQPAILRPRTAVVPQPPITIAADLLDETTSNISNTIKKPANDIVIKRNPTNLALINELLKKSKVKEGRTVNGKGESIKYHVVSLNKKKQGQIMSELGLKTLPTNPVSSENPVPDLVYNKKDEGTQTDCTLLPSGEYTFVDDTYLNFFEKDFNQLLPCRQMLDPTKCSSREDVLKLNLFNDMRAALSFDASGNLPIHDSVMANDLKALKKHCFILKAMKQSLNVLNQQSFTALHLAVINEAPMEILKHLVNEGADLAATDAEGNTALHLSVEYNRLEILKFLLVACKSKRLTLSDFNYDGYTPLILAVLNQHQPLVELLLKFGANPNVKDKKSGRTPLFHAAELFHVGIVRLLMSYNADTKSRNFFGTSAHDAMFEIEDMPLEIRFAILGREHQKFLTKRKIDSGSDSKKLETTAVLKRIKLNAC